MPQTFRSFRLWIAMLVILAATLGAATLRASQTADVPQVWPVSGPV